MKLMAVRKFFKDLEEAARRSRSGYAERRMGWLAKRYFDGYANDKEASEALSGTASELLPKGTRLVKIAAQQYTDDRVISDALVAIQLPVTP